MVQCGVVLYDVVSFNTTIDTLGLTSYARNSQKKQLPNIWKNEMFFSFAYLSAVWSLFGQNPIEIIVDKIFFESFIAMTFVVLEQRAFLSKKYIALFETALFESNTSNSAKNRAIARNRTNYTIKLSPFETKKFIALHIVKPHCLNPRYLRTPCIWSQKNFS